MSQRRYLLFIPLFLAACAVVGGLFGPFATPAAAQFLQRNASNTSDEDIRTSIKNFTKVYDIVDQNYADKLSADKGIYSGADPRYAADFGSALEFF